jgi:hypothetical protein
MSAHDVSLVDYSLVSIIFLSKSKSVTYLQILFNFEAWLCV